MADIEYKNRIMYLGKYLTGNNNVGYRYIEITDKNEIGEKWSFNKKLFKKGTIGSIYKCNLNDGTINYNSASMPVSLLKMENGSYLGTFILFDFLYEAEENTRQIDIKIRNSKKGKTDIDYEILELKRLYKNLSISKRSAFIGNLIFKITN